MRESLATKWMAAWCWSAVLLFGSAGVVAADVTVAADAPPTDLDRRIAALIEQLGAPQYHSRERAQEDLKRLGSAAIDALLAAQEHTDTEIAMRARFLVRSMPIQWTTSEDSPQVRQLFQDYSDKDRDDRILRATHLSTLEKQAGVAALCRIMRFDSDPIVSKKAAVLALRGAWPDDESQRLKTAARIRAEVAACERPASKWLVTYAKTLESPAATVDDWAELTRREAATFARSPLQSDREVVRDLFRWQAELLIRLERRDEAADALRSTFDLLTKDSKDLERVDLYELLEWAIEHELHRVADDMAQRFAAQFDESPHLLYGLAESQWKRGQRETAEITAERARRIQPDNLAQHEVIGWVLLNRERIDWAEHEFRFAVNRSKPDDGDGAGYRWRFSRILFDWGRELEAGEMVKVIVDAAKTKPEIYERLDPFNDPPPTEVQGYMNYYFGMNYAKSGGDREKQIEYLKKAIELSPKNSDFVIALHRVPQQDDAWKQDVKKRIESLSGELRTEMRALEMNLQRPMDNEQRTDVTLMLAGKCNEYAWLMSNTEGDLQDALRASQRSLELRPEESAYLDTLGRCYYAVGDYEQAIKFQKQAVKKTPTMQVMRRQLAMFEKALEESRLKPK